MAKKQKKTLSGSAFAEHLGDQAKRMRIKAMLTDSPEERRYYRSEARKAEMFAERIGPEVICKAVQY